MNKPALSFLSLLLLSAALWFAGTLLLPKSPIQHPRLSIAISATPLSSPFILASQLGYFKQHGLEVEIKTLLGGFRCFEALVNEEVDLATSSESVVMYNAFTRDDFSIIATFVTSDNDVKLITRRGNGIKGFDDIRQRRAGVVQKSASEYFLETAMVLHGIERNAYKIDYLQPETIGDALKSGRVDLISVWEPFAHQIRRQLGDDAIVLPTRSLYRLSFNLLARRDELPIKRDLHIKLLKALDDAVDFAITEPEQAKAIVADALHVPRDEIDAFWPDYHFHLTLDKTLQLDLLTQARWAIGSGYVNQPEPPDFESFIDETALNRADREINAEEKP